MQWAERCFSSLKSSSMHPDVYVVDNGSTDGTQGFIKAHYPEVMFHQSTENLGFGNANNMGLQYALDYNYDYVYLLNQDAWVMEDTFEKLVSLSKQYPDYGILSPFQMNSDLIHIDSGFISSTCSYSSNTDIFSDIYSGRVRDIYSVSVVMAAHWLITRNCLMTVGGFSPSYKHYGEDYDYAERVHFYNIKIGVAPFLKVVHDRGKRVDSKKTILYLEYTTKIRILSNPNVNVGKSIILVIISTFADIMRYKSITPLLNLFKLSYKFFELLKNRRKGMNEKCAFLNYF